VDRLSEEVWRPSEQLELTPGRDSRQVATHFPMVQRVSARSNHVTDFGFEPVLSRVTATLLAADKSSKIKIGMLNGLFVLGHSIGFISHPLDQKRPLYRHPAD